MSRRIFYHYQLLLKQNIFHNKNGDDFPWMSYAKYSGKDGIEWATLVFLKDFGNYKDVDKLKLQSIIIRSKNAECIMEFVKTFPWANMKRCQKAILETGKAKDLRKFAKIIDNELAKTKLRNLADVYDIFGK